MIRFMSDIMTIIRDEVYRSSIKLAKIKGSFPVFDKDKYLESNFIKTLPEDIKNSIKEYGIRNSHLLSIAPTGTISLFAGNISSGIEPPFSLEYDRRTLMPDGSVAWWNVMDYAWDVYNKAGKTSEELSADEHINVLIAASKLVDSACSKTCNVGNNVTFDEFKELYMKAYEGGASGCTTFRPASIEERGQVLRVKEVESNVCFIDPETGERTCAD